MAYQELIYRNEVFKTILTGSPAIFFPRPPPVLGSPGFLAVSTAREPGAGYELLNSTRFVKKIYADLKLPFISSSSVTSILADSSLSLLTMHARAEMINNIYQRRVLSSRISLD